MPTQTEGTTNYEEFKLKQLITPKPCPQRGKPFPLSGNEDWFIFPHGKSVYLYNLKNSNMNKEYREHAYPVGVAKLSPSGTSIASGDQTGNLRIFNVSDLTTKLEVRVLGGRINDLCWSEDEKFIGVCGEGRDQFANLIKVDGGASFGELIGPSKASSSITLTSTHCFLGSDDKSVTIYRASPTFKFVKSLKDHEGFVQVVKCSGDGKMVASGGGDGKVFIYSMDTFEVILNGPKLHDAGILALEWCNNDNNFITASADKRIKLWSLKGELIRSSSTCPDWTFEKQICGLKVIGDRVIVMRLDGDLEIRRLDNNLELEIETESKIFGSIGHAKGIVDLLKGKDGFYHSLSYDGNIKSWRSRGKQFESIRESSFGQPIQKLLSSEIGIFEDKLKGLNSLSFNFTNETSKIVGFNEDFTIVLSDGRVIKNNEEKMKLPIENIEIAKFSPDSKSNLLSIFSGTILKIFKGTSDSGYCEIFSENISGKITAMSFNEDGKCLATADDQRRIKLYTVNNEGSVSRNPTQWCNHSARIDSLAWINSEYLLSTGIDGYILSWSFNYSKNGPVSVIKNAHSAPINCILVDREEGIFMSGASDSCIKVWTFE